MYGFVLKRLALAIPVLLGIATIIFFLMFAIPGDPVQLLMGQHGDPETAATIRSELGLDKPLYVQYFRFIGRLLKGDLGRSYRQRREVTEILFERLPATLKLGTAALCLAVFFGIAAGIIAALNRNKPVDGVVMLGSLVGISTPVFWLGLMLIVVFAVRLKWLPVAGYGTGGDLRHLVLPAVSLSLVYLGYIARITRSSLLEVIGMEFLRTARAKGLAERVVLLKHALRAALLPIVSITGFWVAVLIGDSVLTEVVFARPGLGKMLVGAINQRDYTALQSIMVIYAAFVVVVNLLTDLTYGFLDPRITR